MPARFWNRRYGIVTLSTPARYAIAIGAAAVAALVRLAFASLWGPFDLPFITFFPAVMVSAWLGGLGPGLLTTFLAAVLAKWFFIEPQYSFGLNNTADAVALGMYVLMSGVIAGLNELWRRSATAVAQSDKRLRTTVASTGDAVITTDASGRISHLNRAAQTFTGWTEDDALGRASEEVLVIIDEDSREPVVQLNQAIRARVASRLSSPSLLVAKDGREIPIEVSVAPIEAPSASAIGVIIVCRDLTERRKAERAHAARLNDRHTVLLSHAERLARMGSWRWEPEGNRFAWSSELYHIYGVKTGKALSLDTFLERVYPQDRDRVRDAMTKAMQERKAFRFTQRIIRPDGEVRILDSQGDVELDGDRLVALFGFSRDVTEEARAQEALRDREERFERLFSASPAASLLTTLRDERIVDANDRFLELTGFTRDELIGQTSVAVGLWTRGEREMLIAKLGVDRSHREVEVKFRTRQGQERKALASIERVRIGNEDCLLKIFWRG